MSNKYVIQKLDLEDSYIHNRVYWRTMTLPMKLKEALEIIGGFTQREQDLHRIAVREYDNANTIHTR